MQHARYLKSQPLADHPGPRKELGSAAHAHHEILTAPGVKPDDVARRKVEEVAHENGGLTQLNGDRHLDGRKTLTDGLGGRGFSSTPDLRPSRCLSLLS